MKKFIISLVLLMVVLGGIATIEYNRNNPKELSDTELVEKYLVDIQHEDFDKVEIVEENTDDEYISYIAWNDGELADVAMFNREYYANKLTK